MSETQLSSLADSIRDARQRVEQELRAQAERFEKMHTELTELRQLHERTEQEAARQWDEVARAVELAVAKAAEVAAAKETELADAKAAKAAKETELADAKAAEQAAKAAELAAVKAAEDAAKAAEGKVSPDEVLEGVLGALQGLMTCTIPEQVFKALTEQASQSGVRAAIFDVRGKAAWGASAHGFGPALSEKVLRSLIVPLNQDNPFRQVCESGGHVTASTATLKKNKNVLDKLKPAPQAPVLLVPIRSAGTVSAILYADPGEKGEPLPVNALTVLTEFAGAQIDRLIALSGGSAEGAEAEVAEATEKERGVEEAEAPAAEPLPAEVHPEEAREPRTEKPAVAEAHAEQPAVELPVVAAAVAEVHPEAKPVEPPVAEAEVPAPRAEVAAEPPAPVTPPVEVAPPPAPVEPPPPAPAAPAGFDVGQLSEAEQKVHKDAKRFAKLLVSEIELYNKAKVSDGRKNRDLYKRLKSDIDRSRQTFEKRFGKVLPKQVDYFHDELVKNLAANDSSALGPEYPGPSA